MSYAEDTDVILQGWFRILVKACEWYIVPAVYFYAQEAERCGRISWLLSNTVKQPLILGYLPCDRADFL